jgi:putative hydroxymethylpyrimidine transport system substrate-binding protein
MEPKGIAWMRRVVPLLLLVALIAGCGEKKDVLQPSGSKRIELMLDYFPNADHAGIYAAQAAGDFKQAGLDVQIRQPPDPAAPLKQLAAGRVDLAISYEPEVLRARDEGLNVVSVGALVQRPLTSIISLPAAKIRRPADLKGKTVGTAGIDYQTAYLQTILENAGADPSSAKVRNVGFGLVPALVSGKVDAILGGFWNYEGVQLRLKGKHPRIIRMEQAGVPTYDELVLVANADALDRDKEKLRAFIGALSRGTRALRQDPDQAIKGLLDANPDLDPKLQRESVKVTLPYFQAPKGKPYGWQDPAQWDAFGAWMQENKLLKHPPDVRASFDNSLLPGAGL